MAIIEIKCIEDLIENLKAEIRDAVLSGFSIDEISSTKWKTFALADTNEEQKQLKQIVKEEQQFYMDTLQEIADVYEELINRFEKRKS